MNQSKGANCMPASSSPLKGNPVVKGFFEKRTSSVQYVVADPETKRAAIIDPVLDFDPKSGATATHSADQLLAHIDQEDYTLEWILDTHPHADHFSAAGYLKDKTAVPTAIGEKVVEIQKLWKGIYNLPDSFPPDGSQWNRLFPDGARFKIGYMDVDGAFKPLAGWRHRPGRLPWRLSKGAVEQYSTHHGAARRHPLVHRARLLPWRSKAGMGKHSG